MVMTDNQPTDQALAVARWNLAACEEALAESIKAYAAAVQRHAVESGWDDTGDTWEDLDRYGKWRGDA